jgi:hypothetical protein
MDADPHQVEFALANETVIERFATYFRHADPDHDVLQIGDEDIACKNARDALSRLGYLRSSNDSPQLYDQRLFDAIKRFQEAVGHRNVDGVVGPGTRKQLASRLLQEFGVPVFRALINRKPTVFLSYAWADSARVEKLDQWLQDHDVSVIRDVNSFEAGSQVKEKIRESVLQADKVVAVYSKKSKGRDWPAFERKIAEEIEPHFKSSVLIYLCLDNVPLSAHDPHRIAIKAQGKTLKQIGFEILKSLGIRQQRDRVEYDENAPL